MNMNFGKLKLNYSMENIPIKIYRWWAKKNRFSAQRGLMTSNSRSSRSPDLSYILSSVC